MESAPPLRVMVLAGSLGKGGTERVFSLLLEHFDRQRFAPELAIFDLPIAYDLPADVPVNVLSRRAAARSPLVAKVSPELQLTDQDALAWMGDAAAKLAELVNERRPDVIVASPLWASIMALIALERFPENTRLVNIAGAPPTFWLSDHPQRELFSYILQENLNRSDKVVAVSRAISEDLTANFGVSPKRVTVIHTPSNIESIRAKAQEPVEDDSLFADVPTILSVGRLERVKGTEHLLQAVATVLRESPVRLLLIGEGSQRGYLVALAKHLGISGQVVFLGQQDNPFKFMRKATVFVLSSVSEGMPNVLMEAMTCGCPVIATDIEGGVTLEVLEEGTCGRIVPREDPSALACAILELLGDSGLRARLTEEGLRRSKEFDLPGIVCEFEETVASAAYAERETSGRGAAVAEPAESRLRPQHLRAETRKLVASGITLVRPTARALRGLGRRLSASRRAVRVPYAELNGAESRMRLMILIPSLSPGGAAETLARYLFRAGLAVRLVSVGDDPVSARVPPEIEHSSLKHMASRSRIDPAAITRAAPAGREGDMVWLAAMAGEVASSASEWHADAVLADGFEPGRLALISKRFLLPDTPVLVRASGRLRDYIGWGNGELDAAILADYLDEAEAVAVTTSSLAEEVTSEFDAARGKTLVIPSPIDTDAALSGTAAVSEDPRWRSGSAPLFVCALDGKSDREIRWLVDAVALVVTRAAFRVVVAGGRHEASRLERFTQEAGVSQDYLTFVPTADMPPSDVISAAVGFIYGGSVSEVSVPAEVVRAVAAGCPVIAPGGPSLLDELFEAGRKGLLVRPGDPRGLAEAMLQLLWDPEAAADLARSAADRLHAMAAENVAASFEALLDAPKVREVP